MRGNARERERENERARERARAHARKRDITSERLHFGRETESIVRLKRRLGKRYGVATISRMLKNTGLFAEYRSLL